MNLKGVADVLYAAYNSHDLEKVASLYEIDGVHQDIAMGHQVVGGEAIAAGLKKFFGWFPDARWEPLRQMCDADGSIVVTYRLTGTLQVQMGPVIPTGQKISLRGAHVLFLRRGRILSSEDYWDGATFQKQLNKT